MDLIAYIVKKPDEPFNLARLRRDRHAAWRLYLQTAEVDEARLRRMVREACSMEGVRCCCYHVVSTGQTDDL